MKPRPGAIAFCRRGYLGMITSFEPEDITYPDGNKGKAWKGIQLTNKPAFTEGYAGPTGIGTPWSSKYPQVVGYIEDLVAKFEFDFVEIKKEK